MQGRWDDKTDEDIIYAYKDNYNWNRMWTGFSQPHNDVVLNAIQTGLERYEKYIGPQMERRGLTVDEPESKIGRYNLD